MPLIEWKDEFSIDGADVDKEHRELIDLINRLHQSLGSDAGLEEAMEFFGEIHASISAHFALEESRMREFNYDQYAEHKADHEKLLDEIRDLMDEYEDNPDFERIELSRRLADWFSGHFKNMDARLHSRLG